MPEIIELRNIKNIDANKPLYTHITAQKALYVPTLLKGVSISIFIKKDTLILKYKTVSEEYKRYYYLSILQQIDLGNNKLPLSIELHHNKENNLWEGCIHDVKRRE